MNSNKRNDEMKSCIKGHGSGTKIDLYIQPGASRSEITGLHDGCIKIKIKARPVDGEANKELINFLADFFKISKSRIDLISGVSSRKKIIYVDLSPDKVGSLF